MKPTVKSETTAKQISVVQISQLLDLFGKGKVLYDDLEKFLNGELVERDELAGMCSVLVDYSLSLEALLDKGDLTDCDPRIRKMKSRDEKSKVHRVNFELVHLVKPVTTVEVEHCLSRLRLRPATVFELAAFGMAYRSARRPFGVSCYGSRAEFPEGTFYPFIPSGTNSILLSLAADRWAPPERILAVYDRE